MSAVSERTPERSPGARYWQPLDGLMAVPRPLIVAVRRWWAVEEKGGALAAARTGAESMRAVKARERQAVDRRVATLRLRDGEAPHEDGAAKRRASATTPSTHAQLMGTATPRE